MTVFIVSNVSKWYMKAFFSHRKTDRWSNGKITFFT